MRVKDRVNSRSTGTSALSAPRDLNLAANLAASRGLWAPSFSATVVDSNLLATLAIERFWPPNLARLSQRMR